MNLITKFITYVPALRTYMKAVSEFNSSSYESAVDLLDKCMKHPSFNNELVYQHYGQALCAMGQLNEGYGYLLRACDMYNSTGWRLETPQELSLVQETLETLRNITEDTELEVNPELLDRELIITRGL
mgnify:CR=1 FL=1